jgi:predicted alpha/beta-hydrolase family hydrolase
MADDFFISNGPDDARITLVLAHGAGMPMDSPFMNTVAHAIGARGVVRVTRFEFPYMAARRETGKRRAPDPEAVLLQSWREAIARLGDPAGLVIGGKSMGGRIASMIADEIGVAGLVCLGYPFHPPGDHRRLRIKHLQTLRTPTLIIQGTRDSFGQPDEIADYRLSPAICVAWIDDGDHSFKPRVRSGRTETLNLSEAIAQVCDFIALRS